MDDPSESRGLRLAQADGAWSFVSYAELAAASRSASAQLAEAGVELDDTVAIIAPAGVDFLAAYFGALLRGAAPAPIAPPAPMQDPPRYRGNLRAHLSLIRPGVVVTTVQLRGELGAALGGFACATLSGSRDPGADGGARRGALGLLQLTSGSSGQAKAVPVSLGSLQQNIAAIRRWAGFTAQDRTITWLPVHHDMGLIGCALATITIGADLWIMQPDQFVRDPARWLRCIADSRISHTAAPNFGLSYVAQRVRPDDLRGLDFSAWRALIIGAERIDAGAIRSFRDLLAPHGFRAQTLAPAYGLAEATLAVTGLPMTEAVRSVHIDASRLQYGQRVPLVAPDHPGAVELVGCGRPLSAVEVSIAGAGGDNAGEQVLGEICVSGPSVAGPARLNGDAGSTTRLEGGALRTGDLGFLLDSQLYVVGRAGDSLKVRGRTVFAEDVEARVVELGVLRRGRFAAVLGSLDGSETVAVVTEQMLEEHDALEIVRRIQTLAVGLRVVVIRVGAGGVERTTSGKPRRRRIWDRVVVARAGRVLTDSRHTDPQAGPAPEASAS